jgi:rhamnogalacturonan endolyase
MKLCRGTAVLWILCLFPIGLHAAGAPPAPVTVTNHTDRVVLANGLVTAELALKSGDLLSFRLGDRELLAERGYLDWHDGRQQRLASATLELRSDPATAPDGRAELAFNQAWSRAERSAPLDVSLHYVLRPGETALRQFAVFRHPADYPSGGFGQSRFVLRLNERWFDTISVDAARTRLLPPGATPSEVVGPKESMRFTAGPFADEITDKYHYFTESGGHFFHGWMGSASGLGLWFVYGSTEDQNGGPTRQHNTAHWPRMLLKILSCGHYGAPGVSIPGGQAWEKVYGPWALYANAAANPAALRADAGRQAEAERNTFPPAWLSHPAFPPTAGRGAVSGTLVVRDPHAPEQTAAGAWVGLAETGSDWQAQSLSYQPWGRADADGRFTLRAVRPGRYTLFAFVPGVLDEYRRDDVEVTAAGEIVLGELEWRPLRRGRPLWQIGVPDRSAAEFRHGDQPRRWGRWLDYARDFPADVDFTIGRSDPRLDWNFAQGTRPGPGGEGWVGTTWRVRFQAPDPAPTEGEAVLRLAFAAAHNAVLRVRLDGEVLGEKRGFKSDNALARAGVHGRYSTWEVAFPARLLTPGPHVLALEQTAGGAPFKNVMYDCLRLETP